jgi:hypothetical protein
MEFKAGLEGRGSRAYGVGQVCASSATILGFLQPTASPWAMPMLRVARETWGKGMAQCPSSWDFAYGTAIHVEGQHCNEVSTENTSLDRGLHFLVAYLEHTFVGTPQSNPDFLIPSSQKSCSWDLTQGFESKSSHLSFLQCESAFCLWI